MPSLPTERQQQIASFLHSESRKRGSAPTQREIAEHFGFASLNSVRSHLRLMEKKGMLNRVPGKARGLKLKYRPAVGIPLVGPIATGHPQIALQNSDEVVTVSPELIPGSELFALRVKGESMKNDGSLPDETAVLLDDGATLKYLYRPSGKVILRGANPAFSYIVIRADGRRSVQILGKYVGLIRNQRSPR